MKLGEAAATCLQRPAAVPEDVPKVGQLILAGKYSIILAFHVGDT